MIHPESLQDHEWLLELDMSGLGQAYRDEEESLIYLILASSQLFVQDIELPPHQITSVPDLNRV